MVAALAGYADVVDYLVVQKNADFRRINLVYAQVSFVHISIMRHICRRVLNAFIWPRNLAALRPSSSLYHTVPTQTQGQTHSCFSLHSILLPQTLPSKLARCCLSTGLMLWLKMLYVLNYCYDERQWFFLHGFAYSTSAFLSDFCVFNFAHLEHHSYTFAGWLHCSAFGRQIWAYGHYSLLGREKSRHFVGQ